MAKYVDLEKLENEGYDTLVGGLAYGTCDQSIDLDDINGEKVIPEDKVKELVVHIQKVKDEYNTGHKEILNYGTLCNLCIHAWSLLKEEK